MPRIGRLQELGVFLHVIAQGMDRCSLFCDDFDRTGFVLRAIRIFREMGVQVLAWALMGNHLHLVVRATDGLLSKAMQRVLGPHAQSFNRRHGRVGRLFRDRFWSRPVEDQDDLLGLVGYAILNPLRGRIVKGLEELRTYPWTSLPEILSPPGHRPSLVDRDAVLAMFGPTEATAIEGLLAMLARQYATDPEGREYAAYEPDGTRALAGRDRIDLQERSLSALRRVSARIDSTLRETESASARRLLLLRRGWTLTRVVDRACVVCDAEPGLVRGGRRQRAASHARGLVAYFAATYLRESDTAIARATGVTQPAVSRAKTRGAGLATEYGVTWESFFELADDGATEA